MGLFERFFGTSKQAPNVGAGLFPSPYAGKPGYAVIDLETTGLSARNNRILEIAIIQTDPYGQIQHRWATLLNPLQPVGATHIHGIKNADVVGAPTFSDVARHVMHLLYGRVLVAHNAQFDLRFLREELFRERWELPDVPVFCTLTESKYFLPNLRQRRLPDCCDAAHIRLKDAHRALGDAEATAQLLAYYLHPHVKPSPLPQHLELPRVALGVRWPETQLSAEQAARQPSGSAPSPTWRASRKPKATPLLQQVDIDSLLEEGLNVRASSYAQALLEALEDGAISEEEQDSLQQMAIGFQLTEEDIVEAEQILLDKLSDLAVSDLTISPGERAELKNVLEQLGRNSSKAAALFNEAKARKYAALSENLPPLPDVWDGGEPLRVGDSIAFTGTCRDKRDLLEEAVVAKGVHVSGVSKKTAMLVSGGDIEASKAQKAQELGTRLVSPEHFELLLAHIQPWQGK